MYVIGYCSDVPVGGRGWGGCIAYWLLRANLRIGCCEVNREHATRLRKLIRLHWPRFGFLPSEMALPRVFRMKDLCTSSDPAFLTLPYSGHSSASKCGHVLQSGPGCY